MASRGWDFLDYDGGWSGAPDLQKLVVEFVSYGKIPAKAWQAYDRELGQAQRRLASVHKKVRQQVGWPRPVIRDMSAM